MTDESAEIRAQCRDNTPASAIEAMAEHLWLMRDAQSRVRADGVIVIDAKGTALAHPAIKVQIDAARALNDLLRRYARKPPPSLT